MRSVPAQMTQAWTSGDFTGMFRPMQRATVARRIMREVPSAQGTFRSLPFPASTSVPKELPNIKSVSWQRSTDTPVATCKITLWNTGEIPVGSLPEVDDRYAAGDPGRYTFNHGKTPLSTSWGHLPNEWNDLLIEDNIIVTYEGYGFNPAVGPDLDPHMVPSGVWFIVDVAMTSVGTIEISCEDLGRMLTQQMFFPPIIPERSTTPHFAYPPQYKSHDLVDKIVPGATTRVPLVFELSSNRPYNAETIFGHNGRDAFDDNPGTYWLSISNALPRAGYSYEHVQGTCGNQRITEVRFTTVGGGYQAYLCLYVPSAGGWQGPQKVPYDFRHPAVADNDSYQNYVMQMACGGDGVENVFRLPTPVDGVTKIRVVLSNLQRIEHPSPYPYRAGIRGIKAYAQNMTSIKVNDPDNNYSDYTELIKLWAAYAGFHWPADATETFSNGVTTPLRPGSNDDFLCTGRAWGDFAYTGTYGINALTPDLFVTKPMSDAIQYLQDIVGFGFRIDEEGGVVWRPLNMYTLGNVTSTGRERTFVRILDDQNLLDYTATLSSRNQRESVFVGTADGSTGGAANGYVANPIGLHRVGGWTDMRFASAAECQQMADLIVIQQMLSRRAGAATIPGNSAVQIDDQVQIIERVSGECYFHYVKGISSDWDAETGVWTYKLDTYWLGENPTGEWVYNPAEISRGTQEYINTMLALAGKSA